MRVNRFTTIQDVIDYVTTTISVLILRSDNTPVVAHNGRHFPNRSMTFGELDWNEYSVGWLDLIVVPAFGPMPVPPTRGDDEVFTTSTSSSGVLGFDVPGLTNPYLGPIDTTTIATTPPPPATANSDTEDDKETEEEESDPEVTPDGTPVCDGVISDDISSRSSDSDIESDDDKF